MQQKWVEIYQQLWLTRCCAGKPTAKKFASLARRVYLQSCLSGTVLTGYTALGNPSSKRGNKCSFPTLFLLFCTTKKLHFFVFQWLFGKPCKVLQRVENELLRTLLWVEKGFFWKKAFPPFCLIESDVDKVKWVLFLASSQLRDLIKTRNLLLSLEKLLALQDLIFCTENLLQLTSGKKWANFCV